MRYITERKVASSPSCALKGMQNKSFGSKPTPSYVLHMCIKPFGWSSAWVRLSISQLFAQAEGRTPLLISALPKASSFRSVNSLFLNANRNASDLWIHPVHADENFTKLILAVLCCLYKGRLNVLIELHHHDEVLLEHANLYRGESKSALRGSFIYGTCRTAPFLLLSLYSDACARTNYSNIIPLLYLHDASAL